MKILDLFSGLGGFSLGLERTGKYKTVAFCEMDKYCKLVLQKHWKGVKIYNDVKEITKERLEADGVELPEIITGGFPCQPFSVAGKQKGTSDDRHLWPEMFRIIKELKPRWVIGENVKGLINLENGMVFETVCANLEGEGYEVRAFNIPAAGVGAPHRRERIWIIAHSESERLQRSRGQESGGNANGFQQDKERIKSEIRGESERRSRAFGYENMENSRRTLRQGTFIGETNEDEIRKENANQSERSSGSSEINVANANSDRSTERGERSNATQEGNGVRDIERRSEEDVGQGRIRETGERTENDVANTISRDVETGRERQRGVRKESQGQGTSSDVTSSGETVANTESSHRNDNETIRGNGETSTQEIFGDGSSLCGESAWWDFEPNVGRVAHGIPGRVHRLKALGNSIVPKIAEEIGKAIIEAENEVE